MKTNKYEKNMMERHIHIPKQSEWANFIANSAEIDGYLISSNEVIRNRTSPAPRSLALQMTNCCNLAWDFVLSDTSPCPFELSLRICRNLLQGATAEGVCSGGQDSEKFLAGQESLKSCVPNWEKHLDEKTDFSIDEIHSATCSWSGRFKLLDEQMMKYLCRGFSPMPLQTEAAMLAWLAQYQLAYWQPFPDLNGMTGRFVTNAVRLRWSMPIWECDIKPACWRNNLSTYSKFWRKRGHQSVPDASIVPQLDTMTPQVE